MAAGGPARVGTTLMPHDPGAGCAGRRLPPCLRASRSRAAAAAAAPAPPHQTRQVAGGAIGWPVLQPNACRNSGRFETTPLVR
jgi:hypothetical protein